MIETVAPASLWNIVIFQLIADCGLLFASLLIWLVLTRHVRRKNGGDSEVRVARVSWQRKVLLFLLFFAELVPETLVLAFSFVGGFVDLSLAVFLFAVEFCAFSGSVMDHFGIKPPKQVYVIWARLFAFAVGLLVANFAAILDHFDLQQKSASRVATLVFGLVAGLILYCLILFAESKVESHQHSHNPLPSLKVLLTKTREQMYSHVGSEDELKRQAKRVDSLRNIVSSLEHARGLRKELQNANMTASSDIESAVNDVLEERVERHISAPLIGPADGELMYMRGLSFVIVAFFLGLFSFGLTFAWIPLFSLLKSNPLGDYAHSFVEGLSGGMFAAKIAGTFIPRLQAFGFRAQSGTKIRESVFAIASFGGGVVAQLLISLVPDLRIG